jgi:hypothetical protein
MHLTDLQKETLIKELPQTDQGLMDFARYARREIRVLDKKIRFLSFQINYIKEKEQRDGFKLVPARAIQGG